MFEDKEKKCIQTLTEKYNEKKFDFQSRVKMSLHKKFSNLLKRKKLNVKRVNIGVFGKRIKDKKKEKRLIRRKFKRMKF